ncbi:MAG: DMT family transporter [Armatimonadota bacterium]|nr:DMT family transporter [Armatimonadota bacterium]MDW8156557.1 DMT family transporter [Armatimonadota bacterium]
MLADVALLAVAVAWGVTFPLAKWILQAVPPFWYLAVRFAVAACLLVALSWRQLVGLPGAAWSGAASVGLALGAGYVLQTWGLGGGRRGRRLHHRLLVVLVPVLGALWGRIARWEWGGVLVGTLGLGLLTGGASCAGVAELLLLGCATSFAVHILLLDAVAPRIPSVCLAAVQTLVVAAATAPFAATQPTPGGVPTVVWASVAGMGIVASAGAFVVQSWAQRFTPPTHVGLVLTAEPLSAALVARWWLGEVLNPAQWVGAALILTGIALVHLRGPEPLAQLEGSVRA